MITTLKTTTLILLSGFIMTSCSSDESIDNTSNSLIVNIPDPIFKSFLVANNAINTNGDNEIQKTEASAFTGEINHGLTTTNPNDIKSIVGIEYFTNITELYLDGYSIESVDLTKNTALYALQITKSLLTSIDLSMNTELDYADLEDNELSSIDTSNNTELTSLYLSNNKITTIDVSNNTILQELTLYNNNLNTIDISNNIKLATLNLTENKLTSIDVSANTNLQYLHLSKNQLSTIDVSTNIKLRILNLFDNQLFSAFIANGNNNNITTFNSTNNPNLSCIEVDTPLPFNLQNTNIWNKDSTSTFGVDCNE